MDTYLPVLQAIGRLLPIQRVLALGCGYYSTPCFLDRAVFPQLLTLTSFETNYGWWESVRAAVGRDDRSIILFTDWPIEKIVNYSSRVDEYDLIFIDNGETMAERTAAIAAVTDHLPSGIIVIHDFEQSEYQQVVPDRYNLLLYKEQYPATALLSVHPDPLLILAKEYPTWDFRLSSQ